MKILLFLMSTLLCTNINANIDVKRANDVNYTLGTHLEAEDFAEGLTEITDNANASNGEAIDAGADGSITYKVNMEEEGSYRLAVGYYSGGSAPKVKVEVNDYFNETYDIDVLNGWCKDTSRLPIAKDIYVDLVAGENTIKVSAAGPYVNFDYIAIYEEDAPYENEEMYNYLKADGSRIQAEWCVDVVGNYTDKHAKFYPAGAGSDDYLLTVDNDFSTKPGWRINADEAGEYVMQIAYYSNLDSSATYKWNINGTDMNLVFPACAAGWNTDSYTSKVEVKVNLNKGENIIYYSYANNGFVDFDWLRLFKREASLDTKLEAEDYINGDVNAQKNSEQYPFVSNRVIEIAQGSVNIDINVPEEGKYMLFVSSYTGTVDAYQNIKVNGVDSKLVYTSEKVRGWIDSVIESSLAIFNLELNAGMNNIVITKGSDNVEFNYVDLDYFYITKGYYNNSAISFNIEETREKEISSFLSFGFDYTIEPLKEDIVKVENGKLVALASGSTNLKVSFEYDGHKFIDYIQVSVSKAQYTGNGLVAKNTTKAYTGKQVLVDVEMEEGWTFTQTGDDVNVGTYTVTVTFTHAYYEDVIKEVTLTITKAQYTGEDLIAQDMAYDYDGNVKSIIASAPKGWTIEYENNGQSEKGTYEVTVTFTHPNYETVVKTVTLTIGSSMGALPFIIGGGALLGVATAVFFILKKKRK